MNQPASGTRLPDDRASHDRGAGWSASEVARKAGATVPRDWAVPETLRAVQLGVRRHNKALCRLVVGEHVPEAPPADEGVEDLLVVLVRHSSDDGFQHETPVDFLHCIFPGLIARPAFQG